MPKKTRMILEEVEEKNDLVPGSPENPIKLTEKAKTILIKMFNQETQPETPGSSAGRQRKYSHRDDFHYDGYNAALDRLLFLGLVAESPVETEQQARAKTVKLRDELAGLVTQGATSKAILDVAYKLESAESRLINFQSPLKLELTQAGRDLMLKGSVTISL
jgi:hypothetical protein